MKLSMFVKHLIGYTIQVTESKYSVPVLKNDLLSENLRCSLCPHTMFLQARSYIAIHRMLRFNNKINITVHAHCTALISN